MPLCPQCRSSYVEGDRICKQCGYYLAEPLHEKKFCPQCGTAVSPQQNFCHECDAPLRPFFDLAEESTPPSASAPAPAPLPLVWSSRRWLFLVIGALCVLLIIIVVHKATRKPTLPPSLKSAEVPKPGPAATATLPPAAPKPETAAPSEPSRPAEPAGTEAQLSKLIDTMRQANIKKDLLLYMSCFSYLYPNLDKKRQEISKTWQSYDFQKMVFTLTNVRDLGADDAVAEVAWHLDTQNRSTQEVDSSSITYRVWFTKELGHWKIKKLEEL